MTTIYLIRHAEAEGNLYRRIQGQCDVNVTANGRRQIAALKERFQNIPVDACYSSDLTRTQATAQAVCEPKGLPLQLDSDFRELSLGRWENVPFGELYTCEGDLMQVFDDEPRKWRVEGAETYDQCTERFLGALDRTVRANAGKTICVFSHGAIIRNAMQVLFPGTSVGHADNTAVTLLHWDNGTYTAEYFNDNSHLTEEISTLARQNWWRQDGDRKDHNLWFTAGLDEAAPVSSEENAEPWSAWYDRAFAGALFLRQLDEKTGELVLMELLPEFRKRDLAVQLVGHCVFLCRSRGMETLRISCGHPAVERLCGRLGLSVVNGGYEMDLRLKV